MVTCILLFQLINVAVFGKCIWIKIFMILKPNQTTVIFVSSETTTATHDLLLYSLFTQKMWCTWLRWHETIQMVSVKLDSKALVSQYRLSWPVSATSTEHSAQFCDILSRTPYSSKPNLSFWALWYTKRKNYRHFAIETVPHPLQAGPDSSGTC